MYVPGRPNPFEGNQCSDSEQLKAAPSLHRAVWGLFLLTLVGCLAAGIVGFLEAVLSDVER